MAGLLECSTCGENFDLQRRRPKLAPCGHTHCLACVRGLACPSDRRPFHADDADGLQDDLQLICWLEAASQGVLECVRCSLPFDWLLRRPAALDCGHTLCRVCVQEVADASSQQQQLALDESWDYSLEDGDSYSLASPKRSDPGGAFGQVLDCPIAGCMRAVRARDHQHLLDCLDGSAARRRPTESARRGDGRLLSEELLGRLALLEKYVSGHAGLGPKAKTILGPDRHAGLGARAILGPDMHYMSEDCALDQASLTGELRALLSALRGTVEHKDSPRSEQPTVFEQFAATSLLPDLVRGKRQAVPSPIGTIRIDCIKEVKVELDVWDLSLCSAGDMRVKKEALLRSDTKLWKLTGVDCWSDPDWTLRLLRRHALDLEHLQLRYPTRDHLQVVRDAMPHLRRLEVRGWRGVDLLDRPFSFDAAPDRSRDTLEWLEVFLPRPTAMSLLRAHRRSLRKLRFVVSDEWAAEPHEPAEQAPDEGLGSDHADSDCEEGPGGLDSPWGYDDRHHHLDDDEDGEDEGGFCVVVSAEDAPRSHCWGDLLEELGGEQQAQHALSSMALLWPSSRTHDSWRCQRFSRRLHLSRPGVAVSCDVCPDRTHCAQATYAS